MLADDFACDPRNPEHGRMFNKIDHADDLYTECAPTHILASQAPQPPSKSPF